MRFILLAALLMLGVLAFAQNDRGFRVRHIDSKYAVARGVVSGRFVDGQEADLMLGGFGFDRSGGPTSLNHPTGLATDGKRLLVADRWNHRVLVWNTPPTRDDPPDLVLGQTDFLSNAAGSGRHQLNWPGNVAITKGGRVFVVDTNNDRVLGWTEVPTRNGTPADLAIDLKQLPFSGRQRLGWPWGVWTNGTKLAVVATHGSCVLIWNALPTRDQQAPDFVLTPRGCGTPRNVTSDGTFLMLSDHNFGDESRPATLVWRNWPTSPTQPPDFIWREWMKGTTTSDRKLILAGLQSIFVWDGMPRDDSEDPAFALRPEGYRNGDGPDVVVAGGRMYACNYNGCTVLGWNQVPVQRDTPADFALGASDPRANPWDENFFIQNPVVATDGNSLFVSSDFDRKLFVWRSLPDESSAKPDLVIQLPDGPWDNALHRDTLVLVGRNVLTVWRKLPLEGAPPDLVVRGGLGNVEFRELTGVALDDNYLYLADRQTNVVTVWEASVLERLTRAAGTAGAPDRATLEPRFTLRFDRPGRLTSDGTYLAVCPFEGQNISIYRVADLATSQPLITSGPGAFNLPGECLVAHGSLFVANRGHHRVHVWHRIEDALAGRSPDALLGATGPGEQAPGGGRRGLHMPGSLAYDGKYLWVGEFKFSTRILRFSRRKST